MREKHWTTPRLWKRLKPAARAMRNTLTVAEDAMWDALRGRRLDGLKFRRQHPIGRFIVDFFCSEASLAVELDGSIHDGQAEQDTARDTDLAARGVRVVRVSNDEVLDDIDQVLRRLREAASDARR